MNELGAAGDGRRTRNTDGEQQHTAQAIEQVKPEQVFRQHIKDLEDGKHKFGQQNKAADVAQNTAGQTGRQGVKQVLAVNGGIPVAQCLVGTDEPTFLLNHAGDGGQADEHRHHQKDNGERSPDRLDRARVALNTGVAAQGAAVLNIPFGRVDIGQLGPGVCQLLLGLCFGILIFLTLFGKLCLSFV